jgi:predicted GNAT superfamily acetyltransferase
MELPIMGKWHLRILESIKELQMVEDLQRVVWPGSETDIIPGHLMITAVHNGGLVIGVFGQDESEGDPAYLAGFVFGFPGLYSTPDGPRLKHCSHMLAVHPDYRGRGLGFKLKRAQWQMVRHQGLDRITWTFDPLLSRNAYLNIARLGAVCNTYLRELYGEMRDGLNIGLPSDRLEVDWWVNTKRVGRRLSRKSRLQLDLAHYLAAGAEIVNPTQVTQEGMPLPSELDKITDAGEIGEQPVLVLIEIPADFEKLKSGDVELARTWRKHSRDIFEFYFQVGYFATDFIHLPGKSPRSFYVLSHGDGTL